MFSIFLHQLRSQGLKVGMNEWLTFLRGMKAGLAGDVDALYHLGRSVLVHSEADYDAYDLSFLATFGNASELDSALMSKLAKALDAWLENPAAFDPNRAPGEHDFRSYEEMMEALQRTLEQQTERHQGGNRWVGTGGTSPFGSGGRANQGVRIGQGGGSGGRSGVRAAEERNWQNYRTDVPLDVRDFKVALRALRNLARIGPDLLDVDETIDSTAKNAGDIDLVFHPEKRNRVRVALFMDSGGSMDPHTQLVSRLFTAAKETKTFKTFDHYYFHNCIYRWLYTDYEKGERKLADEVLESLTPQHRLVFVGDASMASWELFTSATFGDGGPSGLDRLAAFSRHCAASVWLNPDPPRYWSHPTVSAIGKAVKMFPLTLNGLRQSIQFLRAPR